MEKNQLIAVVVVVVIVAAAGGYLLMTPPAPHGQTLVWETIGNPDYMDPHVNYESFGSWIAYNVYETLYTYEWDSLSTEPTVPLLASGLTVSADGLNYTFTLRQGVTFQDGTPFNASCVKYNFERILAVFDPGGPAWMVAEPILGGQAIEDAVFGDGPGSASHIGNYTAWKAQNDAGTGAIIVLDDYTVRIRLAYPYTPFLAAITYEVAAMISPTFIEKNGGITIGEHNDVLDVKTCGTGPYMLDSWKKDEAITLVRNPHYWREADAKSRFAYAGAIDRVIIKTNDDVNSRIMNIKAGESQATYWPTTHAFSVYNNVSAPAFDANDGTVQSLTPETLHVWAKYPSYTIASIHFTMSPTVDDKASGKTIKNMFALKNVRKAFSHAFNYQTFIDKITNGFGVQGQGPIPIGMFGHDDSLYQYNYSLTKAQEYWNKAMADDGLNTILENASWTINLYYNSGNTVRENAMLLLKDGINKMLALSGTTQPGHTLTINTQPLEWSDYIHAAIAGQVGCWMIGWAPDYADPDNYVGPYVKSTGTYGHWSRLADSTGWDAASIDAKITQAAQSQDATQRKQLYKEIQEAIVDHAAYIWVYQATTLLVYSASVNGGQYAANPMHGAYFYDMWLTE
ncbi:MAG: ABC transporter substrate-binding protein [Candidatus Thorarchaeota archaeon]|nr:ABC transporter substrate-binding protein [Candidatus Thorarchaeota archaeon]